LASRQVHCYSTSPFSSGHCRHGPTDRSNHHVQSRQVIAVLNARTGPSHLAPGAGGGMEPAPDRPTAATWVPRGHAATGGCCLRPGSRSTRRRRPDRGESSECRRRQQVPGTDPLRVPTHLGVLTNRGLAVPGADGGLNVEPLRNGDPRLVLTEDGAGALDRRPRALVNRRHRACQRQINRNVSADYGCSGGWRALSTGGRFL
jgi:hypothetical protein